MIGCIGLDIEGESLFLVVGDLVVDILLDMVGWDREVELKREPNHGSYIRMDDAPPYLCCEDDIARVDCIIEDLRFFLCITIDAEYLYFFL